MICDLAAHCPPTILWKTDFAWCRAKQSHSHFRQTSKILNMLALTSSVCLHVICNIGYKAPSIRSPHPRPTPPSFRGVWPDIQWSGSPDCQSNSGPPNLWRWMKPTTREYRRGGAGWVMRWWRIIIFISANRSCQTLTDKMNVSSSIEADEGRGTMFPLYSPK